MTNGRGAERVLNRGNVGVIRKTQVRFKKSSHSTGLNGWLGVGMRESMTPGPVLGGHVDGWWHHSWSGKFRGLSRLCNMGALHPDCEGCWGNPGHLVKDRVVHSQTQERF